jgi:predicted membrane channel-forming protein YqfA (hemolysin III family)
MQRPSKSNDHAYHLTGWILFIICALLYIVASLESGDALTLWGSLIFLIACFVFIIPLLRPTDKS